MPANQRKTAANRRSGCKLAEKTAANRQKKMIAKSAEERQQISEKTAANLWKTAVNRRKNGCEIGEKTAAKSAENGCKSSENSCKSTENSCKSTENGCKSAEKTVAESAEKTPANQRKNDCEIRWKKRPQSRRKKGEWLIKKKKSK